MSTDTFAGGRYRVTRALAEGGMADVYLARDGSLDRPVAVKILANRLTGDAALRERFAREARMAAALQHPNVVAVFDTGEEEGRPYIVMEFVEGTTLAERIQREAPLPAEAVVEIGRQACAGLAHAHAAGLIHRDVKPGNVLLRSDGTVKIADFGIARAAELTSMTEAGTILGTAAYLAPEQALGEPSSPRTDLYGLGAVLYEALTGEPPFRFETLPELVGKQREQAVRPLRELAADVPAALEAVVLRCLAPDPADRPASAEELAGELEAALPGGASEAPTELVRGRTAVEAPTRRLRPAARRRPRGAFVAVAVVAVLALAGVAAALALTQGDGASEPPVVQPVPQGESPAEQARKLSQWLRDHAQSSTAESPP